MKKPILLTIAVILVSAFLLGGCGNTPAEQTAPSAETTAEAVQAEPLDEEAITLSTFTLNEKTYQLPIRFEEFSKESGYGFTNSIDTQYTEDTELPAYTTLSLGYKIGDGFMFILIANQSPVTIKANEGEIIGVKATRYGREEYDTVIEHCGVNWDSSYDEIIEIHGDATNEETNKDYHLLGYTKKRDSNSNISYSYVADSKQLYSIAISVDNLAVSYGSLEALEEESTE